MDDKDNRVDMFLDADRALNLGENNIRELVIEAYNEKFFALAFVTNNTDLSPLMNIANIVNGLEHKPQMYYGFMFDVSVSEELGDNPTDESILRNIPIIAYLKNDESIVAASDLVNLMETRTLTLDDIDAYREFFLYSNLGLEGIWNIFPSRWIDIFDFITLFPARVQEEYCFDSTFLCRADIEFINREILELGHKAKKAVVMSSHAYKPRYVKREDSYRSGELPNVDDLFADSSYMGTEVFSTIIYETIVPIMKLNCIAFE